MTHLRESEFVDLLDNVLPAARARHIEECAACAEKIDVLRGTLGRVSEVDVPEPSPLFWEHFSARVRDGVQQATPDATAPWAGWLHHGSLRWIVAGALVVIVGVLGFWQPGHLTVQDQPDTTMARESSALEMSETSADDDRAWDLVRVVADEVPWDEDMDANLATRPGTVERAVLSLEGEARAELIRLLEAETRRPGA